jgi:hypothetical protein
MVVVAMRLLYLVTTRAFSWLTQAYSTLRFNGTPPVPLPIKDRDKLSCEDTGERRLLFKTVFVFDTLSRDSSASKVGRVVGRPWHAAWDR